MRSSRSIRPAPRKALEAIFREPELVVEAMGDDGCGDDDGQRLSSCCGLQRCGTSLSQRSHVTQYSQIGEGNPEETERRFKIVAAEFFWVLIRGLNLRSRLHPVRFFFSGHGNKKFDNGLSALSATLPCPTTSPCSVAARLPPL